jgi:RNA polymerase sigma factor (sigma-70 family)
VERRFRVRLDELRADAEVPSRLLHGLMPRLEAFLRPFAELFRSTRHPPHPPAFPQHAPGRRVIAVCASCPRQREEMGIVCSKRPAADFHPTWDVHGKIVPPAPGYSLRGRPPRERGLRMPPAREPPPSTIADLAALGRLWDEHRGRLLAMLERRIDPVLRQRIGAEEILQSTFLDAAREWQAYQRGSPMEPYPWLYRLALDRLIEEYRKHARPSNGLGRDLPLGDDCSALIGGQFLDAGTGPLTAAQRAELADRIRNLLSLLPPKDRDMLAMRYFDQLSTREICEVLNAQAEDAGPPTENALNVRLFRALKKLQQLWQQLYGEPESAP